MGGLYIILIFLAALFLNVPIAISLGIASVTYVFFFSSIPIDMVIQSYFSGLDSFSLIAVPFFILAGDIMMVGGISRRLVDFCLLFLGKVKGALGMVTAFTSMIFAAISGSGPATVACIGGIMVPEMKKQNYDTGFACSLAATSGALGPVIPPSLSFIMYGVIAQLSITELFIAGVVPGVLMGIALMVLVHIVAKEKGYGVATGDIEEQNPCALEEVETTHVKHKSKATIIREALWALMVPVIILGGIYGGFFTPTEAAIIACDYGLIIGIFVYKEIKIRDIPKILRSTALTSGTVMILVSCATAFGRLLAMEQVPTNVASFILSISDNKLVVLLLINIFLLVVGMLMETLAAIIILAPLLLSVVVPLGIDPIHFGVIMVVNLVIGMCTPPVGVNLFVAARIGGIKIESMFKWLIPCIGALLVVLLLVTYIPGLSLGLLSLFK